MVDYNNTLMSQKLLEPKQSKIIKTESFTFS